MDFFIQNIATIIVCMVLAVLAAFVILKLRRDKKKGKGCAGCPYAGNCGTSCQNKKRR